MNTLSEEYPSAAEAKPARVLELFHDQQQNIIQHTDRLFHRLMLFQWVFCLGLAIWLSPKTWDGTQSRIHPHVWLAVLLGGVITSLPVWLAQKHPGRVLTRHTIAVGQMLMSALLIHVTGGRIETHFHVFGSLAILAFYRDWRVLISASVVVFADHLIRGYAIPQSVYGVVAAPIWRSFEHAGWVVFEVVFLIISVRKSLSEMLAVAERQARLEALNESIEQTVTERTLELTREVLERRQTEDKLRANERLLAQAQQVARLGSWEWDIVNNKVTWSEETRRLYGHQTGDTGFTMEKCLKQVHPDDLDRVNKVMAEALKTKQPFVCDHRIILPDGTERIMQGRNEIIVNNRGEAIKMFGVVQDITEAKRAEEALLRSEEQLRQSQKMEAMGRLAGGVAHDFNNLLTVINGYSAMCLREKTDATVRRNAEEILKAAERAGALTRQLLAFSRKQVLQPRVLDLNSVVGGMEQMLRRLIGEDIELTSSFAGSLGRVKADPGQIEQVIMNMAVNARDAMPRGGKLMIRTANVSIDQKSSFRNRSLEPGEYVMLAITDTGVGMTEEVKAHLFEPFYTTKGVGKGTGLGLATCYGIITQSGGDIRVYSEVNSGTTFKIYLPRTDATPEPASLGDSNRLSGGTESVLVVEDDASVRKFIGSILCECGYRVEEAANGPDALRHFDRGARFDLVITDVIMPQMNGKELYEQIKARSPKARILFISGYTDDALANFGVLEDGFSFLEKPFSPARLTRKIREVLIDSPHAGRRELALVS